LNTKVFGDEIFKLERFNLNAKKLKESKFFEWFFDNKLNIEFLVTKESPRDIFPPDSYFREFLMTFHNCINDDHSSIDAVSDIYDKLESKKKLKAMFNDYCEGLNKCLYIRPFKAIGKLDKKARALTIVAVLDVFLYGEFIGDHPLKVQLYKKISQDKNIREFYWFEFYMNIYKCVLLITQILVLNKTLLNDLRSGR